MTADFTATSPSGNLKPRRKNDGALQVWQKEYKDGPPLGREAFLVEWHSAMRVFSVLNTVEFQIVAIRAESPQAPASGRKNFRVHQGALRICRHRHGFHREQWVGHWISIGNLPRVRSPVCGHGATLTNRAAALWLPSSRITLPKHLAKCASFGSQFLPGVDHWRTLLDGASGIDIYGHNGVAAGDIDGDGFDDLYICQPAGLPNRLYRNRGDGTFRGRYRRLPAPDCSTIRPARFLRMWTTMDARI